MTYYLLIKGTLAIHIISQLLLSQPSVWNKKVKKGIEKHLSILKLDSSLKAVNDSGFRCIARRAPTLGQILTPSVITSADTTQPT